MKTKKTKLKNTRKIVRDAYGKIAAGGSGCCSGAPTSSDTKGFAKSIGYTDAELKAIPKAANLGLSCGNPTALAGLKKGEVVLDLGSGAGFDCFLAGRQVGKTGRVIGVDMTHEMLEKARENAKKSGAGNVEFRLGEIENLPVADNSVDAVISNCVINLSTDKARVFGEIRRVLKPGGRVSISDIALKRPLPAKITRSVAAYVGCVAGAVTINEYKKLVSSAGLKALKVTVAGSSCCLTPDTKDPLGREVLSFLDNGLNIDDYAASITVEARKKGK